ncbi:MAG: glycosyltransferase family 4 protein [Cyanobacteria bacterium J06627_8]
MHIAWLGKKSPFCGNVTYGREVTNALLSRGHRVSFFHFDQPDASSDRTTLQEVSIPCLFKSQVYTIPSPKASKILHESLRQLRPDLVHASLTLSPLDFTLPELCADLNIPVVATFHPAFDNKRLNFSSGTQHLTYQIYAPCLAHYSRVIVFSSTQRDMLIRLGVPKDTVVVIPNGVDTEKYFPGFSTSRETIASRRVFVYQGRISPEKNLEALLKAWKHCQMGKDCKLIVIGDGPLAAILAATYGENAGVLWKGFVADEAQRIDILRGADVFILPSLVEGLSLSLLEAMSCGVACVATDAGADGEVLSNGSGITLSTHRVSTQLQTILPLCRDHPELTALLGKKARQRAVERYTLERNITQLEKLYRQVAAMPKVYLGHLA